MTLSKTGPAPSFVPLARLPSGFCTVVATRVSPRNTVAAPPVSSRIWSTIRVSPSIRTDPT